MEVQQHQEINTALLYQQYLKAALIQGPQYYEYEDEEIDPDNSLFEDYQIIQKVGRGKYSDVFKAMKVSTNSQACLKILKPVKITKIGRQIKILKLFNHQNIIKFQGVMRDPITKNFVFAFDYVNAMDYRELNDIINKNDIKFYIKKILEGLKQCHSKGIMHRDIKPQNILIDPSKKILKIADWGLADFYIPNKQYNVRVASRYYKGPELLLNNKFYNYSLDIWSLGLLFAGMIFNVPVIFRGDNNPDQLNQILRFFGTEEIKSYINRYKLKPDAQTMQFVNCKTIYKPGKWESFITQKNKHLIDQVAFDLLKKMVVVDHEKRINVLDALKHPYFNGVA